MPHPLVVAALASYRLSADLVEEANLLWANGRVARAAALAVFAVEADAKAAEWVSEVAGISSQADGPAHHRRIAAGLASLAGMFTQQLEAIVGAEGLSVDVVWEARQRALYIDVVGGQLRTPEEVTVERAASLIAAAQNLVQSRSRLGVDADLLTDFYVDYGDVYRRHVAAIVNDGREETWRTATARLEAELSERWLFGEDGSREIQRRI